MKRAQPIEGMFTGRADLRDLTGTGMAIRHPIAALEYLRGDKMRMHASIIMEGARYLLGDRFDESLWAMVLEEVHAEDMVPMRKDENGTTPAGNTLKTTLGKWLYCCMRTLRPAAVIETGVANGVSSYVILNALRKNNLGTLHSIDLPNNDNNAGYNSPVQTGWAVPDALRPRWQLHIGDAKQLLPALLDELGQIDVFFHDSWHSYNHMMFELSSALPFVREGGVIISDDVRKNAAFSDFARGNALKAMVMGKGGCAVIGG